MATQFEPCNETVHALLRQVMRDHHNALNANEVTIDAIWARRLDEDENGDETLVPALKQHDMNDAGAGISGASGPSTSASSEMCKSAWTFILALPAFRPPAPPR